MVTTVYNFAVTCDVGYQHGKMICLIQCISHVHFLSWHIFPT